MKISGSNGFFGPHRNPAAQGAAESKNVSGNPESASGRTAGSRAINLGNDSELVRLQQQLRELPETRPERIETVKARLANGLYDTREAAAATADALLQSPD